MDVFLQLEDVWALDQTLDYTPFGDIDITEARCGLPGISTKSETLADTPMEGLLELCSSPSEGSFGAEWMEQADFVFPDHTSILGLDEDFSFKPSSTVPPTTTTNGPGPVAECKEEFESLGHVFADEFLHNLHKESSLKLDTPPSPPLSPEEQVAPEIVLDADANHSALQVLNSGTIEFIQSPLSPDDVENVLSSAGSLSTSPSPTPTPSPSPSSPSTVDTSILYTDNSSWSFSSSELYKVVENTDKSRPTPYSRPHKASKSSKSKGRKQTASISPDPSELELELMSKKDRKKLQNKNAAIRYRMKKKQETDEKRTEVQDLEAINVELRQKCDELEREVQCMTGLINEVRKARGQPPLTRNFLSGHSK